MLQIVRVLLGFVEQRGITRIRPFRIGGGNKVVVLIVDFFHVLNMRVGREKIHKSAKPPFFGVNEHIIKR